MTDYERFGDYQPSDRSTASTAITFLFIGLGIGALAALLFAPKSGRQMRKLLRRKYEDAREQADDLIERGTDLFERGSEFAHTATEKVKPFARAAAKQVR
ncbi:MAG TPA: YtxH domain-containing protein [Bryobacteraceae bacterium]|nr:YtxH domain-containing protein [Bryobacteraceae bacterium]